MAGFLSFFWGACLGSFINVLAYRLPREESVVSPGSRCPRCGRPIAPYDNIPVLSWLLLRGRCRRCRKPIPARYIAVEAVMACLSLAVWLRWGERPAWAAAAVLACGALLAVSLIDWDTGYIPDVLSFALIAGGVLAAPLNPLLGQGVWYWAAASSVLGAGVGFLICWATAAAGKRIFGKEAMGGGDLILLAGIGAWSGGVGAYDSLLLGSLVGAVYGVGRVLKGELRLADPVPFGPFLAVGAVFNFFVLLPLGFPFVPIR
ncbi:MAG: prepilin peptidase [Elusimicrobia bacterium]|nr:prepilin peptidase [Elusimicrobiota bacterium]